MSRFTMHMGKVQICSALFLLLLHLSSVSSQLCETTHFVDNIRVSPTPFHGTTAISPLAPRCTPDGSTGNILCTGENALTDGILGPSQLDPELNNRSANNLFISWAENTLTPFLSLDLTLGDKNISAIDLYVLYYPAMNIGLPNFQLYATSRPTLIDPDNNIGENTADPIEFDLLNNDQLSKDDFAVRKITIRPRTPFIRNNNAILLRWTFEGISDDIQLLAMSEVQLCGDTQEAFTPGTVQFLTPASEEMVVVQPSPTDLMSGELTLSCTVSLQGSFEWQWRKGDTPLQSNSKTSIFSSDGTRTSILIISQLSFEDSGVYSCDAMFATSTDVQTRSHSVQFPLTLEAESTVTGYIGEGSVTLSCEVYGYATFFSAPVWTRDNESNFTNTSKYNMSISNGSNSLIYDDGLSKPSIVSSLVIDQVRMEDEGEYTCSVEGASSVLTQLSITGGTAPPTTSSRSTTGEVETTEITETTEIIIAGTSSGSEGVIAGVVVALFIIIAAIVVAIVLIVLFLHLQKGDSIVRRRKPSVNDSTDTEMQRRLTKADIEWQLNPTEYSQLGTDGEDAVYATVAGKSAPTLPAQNFIETGPPPPTCPPTMNLYTESSKSVPRLSTGDPQNNIYAEPQMPMQRRLTNSCSPKLAKLKSAGASSALDQNPIYESSVNTATDSDEQALVEPDVVYAQPIKRKPSAPKNIQVTNSEPVYSETLTPSMFKQSAVPDPNSSLVPFSPIYAEPTVNKKKALLERVKIVEQGNFQEMGMIGMGQFGEVMLAETINLSRSDLGLQPADNDRTAHVKVAIKKLRSDAENQLRESFEKEIQFMSQLKDDNIVMLLAVNMSKENPFIVMEYMENGDLHQYLEEYERVVTNPAVNPEEIHVVTLVHMCVQVASGMRYLASHDFVHRDLATRNCLVSKNSTVKIADFGMSRNMYGKSYYKVHGRALLPIRWMATESFYGNFSEKTDVWSYGVVMWEIFTLCQHQPYEDLEDQEMIQDAVKEQGRLLLAKPEPCPASVYDVMLRCWGGRPQDRATFREVFDSLTAIHHSM